MPEKTLVLSKIHNNHRLMMVHEINEYAMKATVLLVEDEKVAPNLTRQDFELSTIHTEDHWREPPGKETSIIVREQKLCLCSSGEFCSLQDGAAQI